MLVADLDLAQRRDWLDALPVPRDPPPRLLRRPDRAGARRAPSRGGAVTDAVPAGGEAGAAVADAARDGARTTAPGWRGRARATRSATPRPRWPTARTHVGGRRATPSSSSSRSRMVVGPGRRRRRRGATCTRTSSSSRPPLDDAWMRDIGPTFVRRTTARARRGRLGLQRLGRAGLGHAGSTTPASAPFVAAWPGAERHRLAARQRGRRHPRRRRWAPCCSPRPCSSTRAATPG